MSSNGLATGAARRSRFASGAAVKLPISDGDWVLVRTELTYGQERVLANAGLRYVDGQVTTDVAAYDIEKLMTWLLDWSFKDDDGDHIILSRERVQALNLDTAQEITAALDAHIEAEKAKKEQAAPGTNAPAATSPSVVPSAGVGAS